MVRRGVLQACALAALILCIAAAPPSQQDYARCGERADRAAMAAHFLRRGGGGEDGEAGSGGTCQAGERTGECEHVRHLTPSSAKAILSGVAAPRPA